MVTLKRRPLAFLLLSVIAATGGSEMVSAQTGALSCGEAPIHGTRDAKHKRGLTARDLVQLRDIGSVYPLPGRPMFTLSPDGQSIAFQIREADADNNRYCLRVIIAGVDSPKYAREVDHGGDLLLDSSDQLGRADLKVGTPRTITIRWAPDSSWVAFLKRAGGATQVWRARADGSGSQPLTRSSVDVDDFAIGRDGATVVYSTRAGLVGSQADIETEAKTGYHYDERFFPSAGSAPFPPSGIASEYFIVDLRSGKTRPGSRAHFDELGGGRNPADLSNASPESGRPIWELVPNSGFPPKYRLALKLPEGSVRECESPVCLGDQTLAWGSPDLRSIYFLRREGWGDSLTGVYIWEPGSPQARRVFQTKGLLFDCVASRQDSVCVMEDSTQPRRIVRFENKFQQAKLVYDPNPGFSRLAKGRVERLNWRNAFGLEIFGDLIYPTSYRRGKPYPLVVAQYTSRGFLRGGTGDELPIQALANRGFAILSVQRPSPLALAVGASDAYDVDRIILKDFRDRRSVLSAVEIGIESLVQRGLVDRDRVGIAGLSDGSSTVQFAALNSDSFAAASVSGCCWEPNQEVYLGQAIGAHFARSGWPKLLDSDNALWSQLSLSRRAAEVRFPILMQMADEEYLMALQSFTALREAGKPVDLFVYPGEHHFKWQASHRQAVYDRNIAWFEFWLMNKVPGSGPLQREAMRWEAMRTGAKIGPTVSE
jgi:dipeptidyl aminopeptidase/acylaminoacyl peptidase